MVGDDGHIRKPASSLLAHFSSDFGQGWLLPVAFIALGISLKHPFIVSSDRSSLRYDASLLVPSSSNQNLLSLHSAQLRIAAIISCN